ncbi:hypothetical protein Cgig2_005894 [Carnegiea gigantea]|uniref:RING-type E3 ubiquitin transferase n=1 Tax=Carnegiea gigantea TaxID=171969 RepID=A0A9Q1JPW8_9CARY|nr:hypothetical protein Cgig2_005894 [Carnegiea gigantea]
MQGNYKETSSVGTLSYVDREYQTTGRVSTKSDIRALGVVILQLLTSRPAVGIAYMVDAAIERRLIDDKLHNLMQISVILLWAYSETNLIADARSDERHVYRGCSLYGDDVPESELQYGPKIKGSPIKRKRRGMEDEWLEERKKIMELRWGGTGNRVRTKLSLPDHPAGLTTLADKGESVGHETMEMVVDGMGTEAIKRKLADLKGEKVGERKTRLVSDAASSDSNLAEATVQPRKDH